jgi:ABC-type dipeptide/oligopeptide/nickel transport system permease subunit
VSGPRRRGHAWAVAARVACWPLALLALAAGLIVRFVGGIFRAILWQGDPARGGPVAFRRMRAFLAHGGRYLVGRSDRYPPLVGRVPPYEESPGPWHEVKRRLRKNRLAMASAIGMSAYLYVALGAAVGWIYPDYEAQDRNAVYVSPTYDLRTHFLGTDLNGHDVLARALHGTKTALVIGTVAAGLACLIGLFLGAVAGFFGRWIDEVIVWLYTTLESIPWVLLMLSFGYAFKKNDDFQAWWSASFFGDGLGISVGLFTIVLAVSLTFWVGVCRLVRGEFIRLRERDFVTAAKALGLPTRRVIFRHLAPNAMHLVLISFSLLFMTAVKSEVILSFLGVGLDPDEEVSWGQMITGAKLELLRSEAVWWQITASTAMMFGLLLFVNLFTDALRDALDPRLRS